MAKIQVSVVDIDIRRRIEEGMLRFRGHDIRGNDDEYQCFLRLCRMAGVEPLVSTYAEMHEAVEAMWKRWQMRAKLLGGNKQNDNPNAH